MAKSGEYFVVYLYNYLTHDIAQSDGFFFNRLSEQLVCVFSVAIDKLITDHLPIYVYVFYCFFTERAYLSASANKHYSSK